MGSGGVNSTAAVKRLQSEGWALDAADGFHYTDGNESPESVFSKTFSRVGETFVVHQDGSGWQGVFLIW